MTKTFWWYVFQLPAEVDFDVFFMLSKMDIHEGIRQFILDGTFFNSLLRLICCYFYDHQNGYQ